MRIWIDLVNSPQVQVLRPIICELGARGHQFVITTRDFAQTVPLANRAGLRHTPLGAHGGSNRPRSVYVNLQRMALLVRHVKRQRIDLALSHNSYSQALAARLLGVPFVTMMDYEHHRANHVAFRVAKRVIVPEAFPNSALVRFGAQRKAVRYPGLKEEIYLAGFTPDGNFLKANGIPSDRVVFVVRPPGFWADYYQGQGDLFVALLDRLLASPEAFVVFLPRIAPQKEIVKSFSPTKVVVPDKVLDGPNLLWYADGAASAGGTMNREAAVLGTPAYSVFEGELASVDAALERQGRMTIIRKPDDLGAVRVVKKQPSTPIQHNANQVVERIVSAILEAV